MSDQYTPTLKDLADLIDLAVAINRGKEIHPGPYNFEVWVKYRKLECLEIEKELIECELCSTYDNLEKLIGELLDESVVNIRFIEHLRRTIIDQKKLLNELNR